MLPLLRYIFNKPFWNWIGVFPICISWDFIWQSGSHLIIYSINWWFCRGDHWVRVIFATYELVNTVTHKIVISRLVTVWFCGLTNQKCATEKIQSKLMGLDFEKWIKWERKCFQPGFQVHFPVASSNDEFIYEVVTSAWRARNINNERHLDLSY